MSEKMCACKACGQQVAKSAKNCPHCGAKVKKANPILIGIIAVVIIAIVAGAGGNDEPKTIDNSTPTTVKTDNVEETENIADTQKTTEQETKNAFGVGETVELKDVVVSLLSVTENTGSAYNKPTEGNVFVLCEFEIQNNSKEEISVSSMLSFETYCDDYTCNYSLSALLEKGSSNQLDGTVAVGKKLKGVIGYEVPADWQELEIHYTPDVWSSKDIVFIATKD